MAELQSLVIKLRADTAGLTRGLARAGRQLRQFGAQASVVGAGAAAAAGVVARRLIADADQLSKLGRSIFGGADGATEALSELRFAAQRSNVSFETLTSSLGRMQKRIAEGVQGEGPLKDLMATLGDDAQRLVALRPDQQLEAMAQALAGIGNAAVRADLADAIFGRQGAQQLIPLLEGGAEGIRKLREEAVQMGAQVSTGFGQTAERIDDQITNLTTRLQGFARELVAELAPDIEAGLRRAFEFFDSGGVANAAEDIRDIARSLRDVAEVIGIFARFGINLASSARNAAAAATARVGALGELLKGNTGLAGELNAEANRVGREGSADFLRAFGIDVDPQTLGAGSKETAKNTSRTNELLEVTNQRLAEIIAQRQPVLR